MKGFCIGLVCLIFFGDMHIKNKVEKQKAEGQVQEIAGGRLLIRKYYNRGAMLNIGQGNRKIIAVLSVFLTLLVFLAFLLCLGSRGNKLLRLGLTFLLGGAFNNTYDRLKRKYVIDYVSFGVKWKHLRKIVFNISDFCIIIGALLCALGVMQ